MARFICSKCRGNYSDSELALTLPIPPTSDRRHHYYHYYCKPCAAQLPADVWLRARVQRLRIVGLFGSMRFKEEFKHLEKVLTKQGYLVLMPYWDGMEHKEDYSTDEWEQLMIPSLKRIELAHLVYIVDCYLDGTGTHVGDHTQREIEYGKRLAKRITYFSQERERDGNG